jgi:hypothetical protein
MSEFNESKGWYKVSLSNLGNGAAVELFDSALNEVYLNIDDLNTDLTAVREVHLVLKIKPDKNYRINKKVAINCKVQKKLAMHPGVESSLVLGTEDGEFVGFEQEGFQPPLPNVGNGQVVPIKNTNGG